MGEGYGRWWMHKEASLSRVPKEACTDVGWASPQHSESTVHAQALGRMCLRNREADWRLRAHGLVLTHQRHLRDSAPSECWRLEISHRNWRMLKLGLSVLYVLLTFSFFQRALSQHSAGVGDGLRVPRAQITQGLKSPGGFRAEGGCEATGVLTGLSGHHVGLRLGTREAGRPVLPDLANENTGHPQLKNHSLCT